jgi:hypothetical protein
MFESTLEYASPTFFVGEDGEVCVQFRIAYCADTDRDVLLSCVLQPGEDDAGQGLHEFIFEFVILSNDDTYESFSTMDREIAAQFIPREIRGQIIDYVEKGLDMLLSTVRPHRVFRVTKQRNLPDKALVKHRRITQVLLNSGYLFYDAGIDEYGRNYWDMLTH